VLWATLVCGSAAADCRALFDSRQVLTLDISMDPSEWTALRAGNDLRGFLGARLSCEGDPAVAVGIRRVADGGDPDRVSLDIAVDRFVKGQAVAGRSAFGLFRGTRAPGTPGSGKERGFVNLIVNREFAGLYTIVPGVVRTPHKAAAPEPRSLKIAGATASGPVIVINEILTNTPGGSDVEFIELYNAGNAAQDLSGWYLLDDNDEHDPCPLAGTLGPGEYWVVPGLRSRFVARFPGVTALNPHEFDSTVSGQGFALGNVDDQVRLFRSTDSVPELVDILTYGAQGPDIAFGYRPEGADAAEYLSTATPGATNLTSELHSPVCINEFLTTSMIGGIDDWVELYNRSDAAVDIGGWFLSDDADTPERYMIPMGTVIPPGGFLTVDEFMLGFSFSSTGSEVLLLTHSDSGTGQDYYDFGPQFADVAQGRFPDGSPNWHFLVSPSRSSSNTCDAGPTAPGPVSGLAFTSSVELHWNVGVGADAYDVTSGDLTALRDARGDYSSTVTDCVANNHGPASIFNADVPTLPGQGRFYLTRGVHFACGFGTYDTGSASQAETRDAGIDAASGTCP
jgi:hypothetical protein